MDQRRYLRRRRHPLARYDEPNPTKPDAGAYVLAGVGALLAIGLFTWIYVQSEDDEEAISGSNGTVNDGAGVVTLGSGGSDHALPTTGTAPSPIQIAGAPVTSPYYPPIGGVPPAADQIINYVGT